MICVYVCPYPRKMDLFSYKVSWHKHSNGFTRTLVCNFTVRILALFVAVNVYFDLPVCFQVRRFQGKSFISTFNFRFLIANWDFEELKQHCAYAMQIQINSFCNKFKKILPISQIKITAT